MKVTSIQFAIRDLSKEKALARALKLLDRARGSDLILLPEMWPTGFFSYSRYRKDAEPVTGPLIGALRQKAAELKAHLFTGSFVERAGKNLYNSALLIGPRGKILARYRKIHLFGIGSREPKLLKRGTAAPVVQTALGKIGFAICYDMRFPEMFRSMVGRGAEIFLVASSWPPVRLAAWRLFNMARAHENLAFLFSSNAAGRSNGNILAGHSMFVDPFGKVMAEGGAGETLLTTSVDLKQVAKARRVFPALRDRV